MTLMFTVSPDFTPDHIAGWYIFNTWLQREVGEGIHLELYNDFDSQRKVIQDDGIDVIYANPYDAAMLVREKGFLPIAKPITKTDEAVIVCHADSAVRCVEDLTPGVRIASTDDPDVHMMATIMLEPADLNKGNTRQQIKDSYPLVAKDVIRGDADIGFFLLEAFDDLAGITREKLRPLVTSQIHIIHHALMVGPGLLGKRERIRDILLGMQESKKGMGILESLGFTGWESVDDEDMEFMIDLMETLTWELP